MKHSIIKSIVLCLLIPLNSMAATYEYYPQSWLRLGSGINPYLPDAGYVDCLEHKGEERKDFAGVRNTIATMKMIKTREDFYSLTSFSASLAGSYMFFKGNSSYRSEEEDAFHSDSLTWIVFFRSDYGIFGLKEPHLKKQYLSLSTDDLYQTCGSEIVTSQKKSAMAFALFTIKNASESHRKEVEASMSGGAQTGIWSAQMEASYKSVLRSAIASTNLEIRVNAVGGKGKL